SDDAREQIFFRNFAVAESESASDRRAERPFAVYVPRFEARSSFFDEETADFVIFALGPHDGDVGDGAAGDPHFFAVEDVLVSFFNGAREHTAGVGAELRFGQAEAADLFSLLEQREPFLFLRVAAERIDRIHHEGALHGDKAADAGVAALELLRHQSVGDAG